ncbi:hypothetical protein RP20_CCG028552 [Aedes albopictus]|nr:hypothetical protein RP20_CCG028552 [Aedes albopictus]
MDHSKSNFPGFRQSYQIRAKRNSNFGGRMGEIFKYGGSRRVGACLWLNLVNFCS